VPLLPNEEHSLFLMAQEGCHGHTPGLEAVKTADGTILREPAAVEAEEFQYLKFSFMAAMLPWLRLRSRMTPYSFSTKIP
jgi:hypothetical protein